MNGALNLALAVATGGTGTLAVQTITGWWKARAESRHGDREVDATLEKHRDQLTFDLLSAARDEMTALRGELGELRPLSSRVAHLEEALDHIYALLHADGEIERRAAEKRAKAFLRRMRPDIGDLRNAAQKAVSAKELIRKIEGDGA